MEIEIAVGQLKPRKADYDANLEAVGEIFAVLETEAKPVDLLVLPETALSGYFLEGGCAMSQGPLHRSTQISSRRSGPGFAARMPCLTSQLASMRSPTASTTTRASTLR